MDVIEEIIEYLKENPTSNIDECFKSMMWSMEYEEWSKMTDKERR